MSNIRLIGVLDNENKSEEIFEEITCELLWIVEIFRKFIESSGVLVRPNLHLDIIVNLQ